MVKKWKRKENNFNVGSHRLIFTKWKDPAGASLAVCGETLGNETKAQLSGKETQRKCSKLVLDLE